MGLLVLTLAGDRISAITRFDNSVLAYLGLPPHVRRVGTGIQVSRRVRRVSIRSSGARTAAEHRAADAVAVPSINRRWWASSDRWRRSVPPRRPVWPQWRAIVGDGSCSMSTT
jgi:hypothetical protein